MTIAEIVTDKETDKKFVKDYRLGALKIEYVQGKLSDLKEWFFKK